MFGGQRRADVLSSGGVSKLTSRLLLWMFCCSFIVLPLNHVVRYENAALSR